jgi:thiol-disulfide isomerase/thioredoxin
MIRRLFCYVALLTFSFASLGLAAEVGSLEVEKTVAELVAKRDVTVVHFWAPWCSNCKSEMGKNGWAKFVSDNPNVKVVFINIWHKGQDPAPKLRAAGLGDQPNLVLLNHPNPSNQNGEKVETFLGLPLEWTPTTWIYRSGKLRYALNYGEIRFGMLQQMVDDADKQW